MPRANGTGPPWSGGPRSRRSSEKYLGRTGSELVGNRIERYTALIEALIPFVAAVSGLVKLFKKPKCPSTLTDNGLTRELELKRGDEYAER